MKLSQTSKGYVLFNKTGGFIWMESFSATKNICLAKAKEFWALNGETQKENKGWKPIRAEMVVIVDVEY